MSNEPSAWACYDTVSSLPSLLRHDTWSHIQALSLICDIDPILSERFYPAQFYSLATDEMLTFQRETGINVGEFDYWAIHLLSDCKRTKRRVWFSDSDNFDLFCMNWQDEDADQLTYIDLASDHLDARTKFREIWGIFASNPEHYGDFAAPTQYFIDWAAQKKIPISWLEWAKTRGYIEHPARADASSNSDLDKRERDTLDTLIGALLHKLQVDPEQRGAIKTIVGFTEDFGAPIRKTAVSEILRRIKSAKESVQDRKRR